MHYAMEHMQMHRTACRRGSDAGFSLLELMIVVGTVAAIMAMLALGIRMTSESYALRRAAGITMSELRKAQATAMAEGVDYTVEFYVSSASGTPGGIRVWRAGIGTPVRTVLTPDWPASVQMQQNTTTFPACTAPVDTMHKCAVYKPLGYPVQNGLVKMSLGTGITLDVVVEPATGRVSVQR